MNPLHRLIKECGHTPAAPLAGFPGIQLTNTTVQENLFHAPTQIDTLLALFDTIQPDVGFAMMDLTVEAEYLGCGLTMTADDPPAVADPVLTDVGSVDALFENKTVGGRMPLFAEVVKGLKRSTRIPVCAYVIGPLTLAGEVMDLVHVMKATRKQPDQLHRLLSQTTGLIMNYIDLLEDAGADLICVLEPSAMMISARQFNEFSGQYCGKLFNEGISGMGVLHICGDTNHIVFEMAKTGAHGLSLDKQVNLPEVARNLQSDIVLMGNIDPVSVLALGDAETVKAECRKLVKDMAGQDNFVLSSGCDIPQLAPVENVKAMVDARNQVQQAV